MGISFTPAPTPYSETVLGYYLECGAYPRRDRREFATAAVAARARADHHLFCGDQDCGNQDGGKPRVQARRRADTEPRLDLHVGGGVALLRVLGLIPEAGVGDVLAADPALGAAPARAAAEDVPELCGQCRAEQLLGRIILALELGPRDDGGPAHYLGPGKRFLDCGRPPGYVPDRLARLDVVARYARSQHRDVVWS